MEQLHIYAGNRYDHDQHGEVLVTEIERRVTGVSVARTDDRTTMSVGGMDTFYVKFQHEKLHIDSQPTKSQKLEDFQHAIHD